MRSDAIRIGPQDLSIGLLRGLAALPPALRDAWIDRYVVGMRDSYVREQASRANVLLREFFGSSDGIREAA